MKNPTWIFDDDGSWTKLNRNHSSPYYYGDYYVAWSLLQGYVQMHVSVEAYESWGAPGEAEDHYLGSDEQYVTLPGGGGGNPVPEWVNQTRESNYDNTNT